MTSGFFVLKPKNFLVFILLSYAVVVSLFLDSGLRNYLVLSAAMLGGILIFAFRLQLRLQAFWVFLLLVFMGMSALLSGQSGALGGVLLTSLYAVGYVAIASLLVRVGDPRAFVQTTMRRLIYAFAILSVIQMITSLTGLPIPNLIQSKGLWSYNSLAFEPAQLGRIVGMSMLCYLIVSRPTEVLRTRQKVVGAFLVTMLLSGSALAAAAILVVFVLSRSLAWVFVILTASVLFWPVFLLIDFEPLRRAILLVSNLGSLDTATLMEADGSGALRILPAVIYLNDASPAEWGFWFGYGNDGLSRFFAGRLPGLGDEVAAGFLPGFAVVYGVLPIAMFVWVFALRQANRFTAPLIVFWLIFITSSAWNTQVFWYGLILIQITYMASRESTFRRRSGPQ